jgi:hypothetical protein
MKPILAFAALLFVVTPFAVAAAYQKPAPQSDDWLPSAAQVATVEAAVKMPPGAKPLSDYTRYYTGIVAADGRMPGNVPAGHKLIWGKYDLPFRYEPYRPGIHVVARSDMPLIMDGGCMIVNVYYDVDAGHIVYTKCNGVG